MTRGEKTRGGETQRGRRAAALATVGVLAMACLAGPAAAIEERKPPPLTGRLTCTSARARTSGPLAVEVELDWRGRGLLEGRLRIDLVEGPEVRCRYERPDVALTNGPQAIRLILPSPGPGGYNSQLEAHMTFISEKGTFRLPACSVFVPRESERGLVVAFSEPRGRPGPETLALYKALRLEIFDPGRRSAGGDAVARGTSRPLATTPSYPSPGDMPSGAAACCAFDMVVLAGEGFGLMRAKQTDAILTWVRAGGSVLVVPGGGLKAHHARFLNALAGTDAGAASPVYELTPGGRVEGERGLRSFHAGLGRAVVGLEAPTGEDALRGSAWRRAAAFLWKVRRDQLDRIVKRGEWTAVRDAEHSHRGRDGRLMFGRVPIGAGSALEDTLFPERIKVIPLWVIIFILALFVAVIGPVDYFVLGLLRRRKLTWITFPAAAVGFALFTMLLAEVYMGSTDHRNSVTVVDLGRGGKVLRTSRYEVIVAGRNRDSRTDVAGGFFAPVDPAVLPGSRGSRLSRGRGMPRYEGLLPARFTAMQQINQWEPQMNRFLFIGAEAPPLERQGPSAPPRIKLDWDDIQPVVPGTKRDAEKLREVREAIVGSASGAAAGAVVFRGGKMRAQGNVVAGLALQTVHELCVRPRQGFFTVVSQVSPTGGGDFEDSALLDPTDPDQWLLAVVVRDGQNFTIYRRLFHEGADARAP
ncbi:MAG: hypothetical protein ACYTKD_02710 [Planctomycetota bacterium]